MKRKVVVFGIGAAHAEFVTLQAVASNGTVSIYFVLDTDVTQRDVELAKERILQRYVRNRAFRTAAFLQPPVSGRVSSDIPASDAMGVKTEQLDASQTPAFLVYGAPLRGCVGHIVNLLRTDGLLAQDHQFLAERGGLQALTTTHKVALFNTGRGILLSNDQKRLSKGSGEADSIAVMIEVLPSAQIEGTETIYWASYCGMPNDLLVAGNLEGLVDDLEIARRDARSGKGWSLDKLLGQRRLTATPHLRDRR